MRAGCTVPRVQLMHGAVWKHVCWTNSIQQRQPSMAASELWAGPTVHACPVQVLVVHGGLFSRDGVTLDDIRAINRNMCARRSAVSMR
jgi:hypothetical protein